MAEVTNESFQELISTTKETNKILREDMALESKPDPGKFIKEEASNLLLSDLNRRSSKELLKTEQQERDSDKKNIVSSKQQRVKLIEEQEKTTKALLMMASNQDMQSKIDTMLESATAEDEEKKTNTFKKMLGSLKSIKEGFVGFGKTFRATEGFLKKMPGSGLLMRTLKGLGFIGLIALLNDPRIKALGTTLVKKVLPALAYVIDNVIKPFIDFVFEMFTGTHPALVAVIDTIKKYGPNFLKDKADGISDTMGLLAGALAVGVLFAPFKTLGLMTATGVFTFKVLTKAIKKLANFFSGAEKGVDKLAKTAKVTSTAAGAAGAVAGASKVVTGKPGTFDPKTKRMFGADSKLTTTMKGDKGAAELSKRLQAQAGGANKLSHLKKFPRLMRIATRLPFLGTLLSTGMLVTTLLDDRISKEDKIKEVGGVIGGAIGGFGGAKLGALAGAMTGPIGALVGALGGGLLGFFAGDEIGQMIAEFMMDGKQPERPKVTATGGHARRNQIRRQREFDAAMADARYDHQPSYDDYDTTAGGRGRGPTAAELSEMRNLPRSNGGAGQGMQPVNAMQDRSPPISPILNAPTSVVDNSQTSYSTNTKSLIIPDNVIATLNAVR